MATQNNMDTTQLCRNLPGQVCEATAERVWDGVTAEEAEELWRQAQEDQKQPRRRYSFHHLQRALGILPPKDDAAPESMAARWTEDEYNEHCAPVDFGAEWNRAEQEWAAEREDPSCHYCHPTSGCDGDHGDECRDGIGPIYKGPRLPASPLTVPPQTLVAESNEDLDEWANSIQRLIAESKAIREAPNSTFVSAADLEDDTDYDKVNIEEV